jgi:hypothetical protein
MGWVKALGTPFAENIQLKSYTGARDHHTSRFPSIRRYERLQISVRFLPVYNTSGAVDQM